MATINKIKVGNNTYDLSAAGNYLPLSGGTMTGPIVQGFNGNIITDLDQSWFDISKGFDLYTAEGNNVAYLIPGEFALYTLGGNSAIELYTNTTDGYINIYKNNGDYNIELQKSYIKLYNNNQDEAVVAGAPGSYGTLSINSSGDKSVFISGSTAGDQDGCPRIELYNQTINPKIILGYDEGLRLYPSPDSNSNYSCITLQDNYLALGLNGNELVLGNTLTTQDSILYVNYRQMNGCGKYTGISFCAGSTTSKANIYCGYVTATKFKLSSGTANQVLMADGSVRSAHTTSGNTGIYNAIPFIKSDGVMEVGKYIDFHQTDSGTDYDTRITCNNGLIVNKSVTAPAFYQTSDIRKKDIKEEISLDKCYDLIDKCQTIIYSLKDQTKEQVGMIAQEVEKFFPEIIQTDEEGFKSLDYSRLVVICFRVLKDLIKRVSKLEEK